MQQQYTTSPWSPPPGPPPSTLGRLVRSPWLWVGVGLVLAAVAAALLLLRSRAGEDAPEYRFATERFENEAGGYVFQHPPGWDVVPQGTATKLRHPDRSVVVSFGKGASGSLQRSSQQLLDQIRAAYRKVAFSGAQLDRIGGNPSLLVAGSGTNAAKVPLRFVVVTVQTAQGNFSIAAFTVANSDPGGVLPPLQEIVGSFRPLV